MFLAWVIRKSRKRDQTRPAKRTPGIFLSVATDPLVNPLFLGLLLLGLVPRALLPDAHQAGVGPRLPELLVGTTLDVLGHVALGNLAEASGDGLLDAERGADVLCGLGGLLVLGGVGLLGLVGLAGENDKAGLVLLQALDVDGERLLRQVLAAVINRDADGAGILLGDSSGLFRVSEFIAPISPRRAPPICCSYLQLSEREAAAEACPAVVLDGAAIRVRAVIPPEPLFGLN